jgi:hypothetical protein
MGEAEININERSITLFSHLIIYGDAANVEFSERIRSEIENMWNEPQGSIQWKGNDYRLHFIITSELKREIDELEILQNTDPRNNYFRIEEYAQGNISFVDGIGCNTGYFKVENLYVGSTTAAHEFGHTIGLNHPSDIDFRGKGVPGIMYPRGTLVDPEFQYDPTKPAGVTGGTMHPMYRKVRKEDIAQIKISSLSGNRYVIGNFTNVFHLNHSIL